MTNPNDPAYPEKRNVSDPRTDGFLSISGLTKRERFAMAAMQGDIADGGIGDPTRAKYWLEAADNLIAELNSEEPK